MAKSFKDRLEALEALEAETTVGDLSILASGDTEACIRMVIIGLRARQILAQPRMKYIGITPYWHAVAKWATPFASAWWSWINPASPDELNEACNELDAGTMLLERTADAWAFVPHTPAADYVALALNVYTVLVQEIDPNDAVQPATQDIARGLLYAWRDGMEDVCDTYAA